MDRRPGREVDGLVGAETTRELELGLADPVGDHRRGRKQPRKDERERSERAETDDADCLSRPRLRAREPLEDHRRRLHQHGCVERDAVGQPVDDTPRRDHELAVSAAAGEAELVVGLAEVCVAGPAAAAGAAIAVPLADDAVTGLEPGHALAYRLDHPAPLVSRDARVTHPAQVQLALQHLDVGAAEPGEPAAHQHVSRPAGRGFHFPIDDLVRALDHDRLHGPSLCRAISPGGGGQASAARCSGGSLLSGWGRNSTSSRSMRVPSRSTTVKRSPSSSIWSPCSGARPRRPKTYPPIVW